MQCFIENTQRINEVIIPPSKSYAQRAILAASLCSDKTEILNIGNSEDVKNILQVAKNLGANIIRNESGVIIQGFQFSPNATLNVGESGLGFRLTACVAAVMLEKSTITGEGSLKKRPMSEFETILPQLGLKCSLTDNLIPLNIQGKAKPGNITIDGSKSSQYLSGLLMALPLLKGDSTIFTKQLTSTPYIDITIDVLQTFNINNIQKDNNTFRIPGNQVYKLTQPYKIEGDYSGASIWMVHGAITSGIQIEGLNKNSVQGDKSMLDALKKANVGYTWDTDHLIINPSQIIPYKFDATQCPDLFPALVVLAAAANGTSQITGVNRLIHKESNRAIVLQKEFKKLGLKIDIQNDVMHIHGTGNLINGTINSNNDHRIAMAGAIAASLTSDKVCIEDAESVNKSYPNFWQEFGIH